MDKSGQHGIITVKTGNANSYILPADDGYLLIDTGTPGNIREFEKALEADGASLTAVKLIILTHNHYDHAGSLADVKQASGAPVVIHHEDSGSLKTGMTPFPKGTGFFSKILIQAAGKIASGRNRFSPVTPDFLMDGEYDLGEYGINGKVFHTPGHTSGSVIILIDGGICFTGDTMFHFSSRTVFPPFANDIETLLQSWRKIDTLGCVKFYPGHGEPFGPDLFRKSLKKHTG